METNPAFRLSTQAFAELEAITLEEFGDTLSDQEIEDMGVRLLRLFDIMTKDVPAPTPEKIVVTQQERKGLDFLRQEINCGRSPSVRAFAKAMGFRSSRSGFRMLKLFISRGWAWRNKRGSIRLKDF